LRLHYRNGLFNFSKSALPLLLESVGEAPHPPSLLITGATASLRGSARFATFAVGKFGVRALGQSLAREFGPKGKPSLYDELHTASSVF
jgi:NAD(P)-dependent dehydrogenase (short-subunit alcohol dehydrogenase family)